MLEKLVLRFRLGVMLGREPARVFAFRGWERAGSQLPRYEFLQGDGSWAREVHYFETITACLTARDEGEN